MDFNLSPRQQAVSISTKAFATLEIAPYLKELEEDVHFRMALYRKMAQQGLFLLALDNDTLAYSLALKEIAKADAGISVAMTVTNMVAKSIQQFGTQHQKDRYLQKIRDEGLPAAFALTEKQAGSDAKQINMQASFKEDCYFFNGEKHLISNADLAGFILVLAQVPQKGITAFLVDQQTTGLSVICREEKLGLLTAHLVRIRFENCCIPVSQRLGEEGDGLNIAFCALNAGRIGVAAQALGIAEAAYEAARHYAKEREQFGHQLIDLQAIAFKLADMHMKLTIAEMLLYKACWMQDQQQDVRCIAAEAKLFNSEAANAIATEALQIFGGYGYIKSNLVEKYFRDARATTLYEGSSEIQRLIIARWLDKL